MFEIVRRDPDFALDMFVCALADSANPYYAWQALGVCLKHQADCEIEAAPCHLPSPREEQWFRPASMMYLRLFPSALGP